MSDHSELKRLAEAASQQSGGASWAYEPHGDTGEFGVGVLEDDQGNPVAGRQSSGEMLVLESVAPEVSCEAYAVYIAAANPAAVLGLIAKNELSEKNWQAECLAKGFEYVREPDDHYVIADTSEMVNLLRDLLGVDVRQKDGDTYGESVRELQDQIDGLISILHDQQGQNDQLKAECEGLRKERDRLAEDNRGLLEDFEGAL